MVTRMRSRRTENYRERYPTEHNLSEAVSDHDVASHQRDQNQQDHSDYAIRFEETLGDKARAAYRDRRDLADYSDEVRLEILAGWVQGFNNAGFTDCHEREAAARDVAASIFRPCHRRLDECEHAESQLSADELKQLNFVLGGNQSCDGKAGDQDWVEIKVADLAEAHQVMGDTGRQAQITYIERHHLLEYERELAAMLYRSNTDPEGSLRRIDSILNGASAFSKGEDDFRYRYDTTFDWLAAQDKDDDSVAGVAIDGAIAGNWSTFEEYMDYLAGRGADVTQYLVLAETWKNRQADLAREALDDPDRAAFEAMMNGAQQDAIDLIHRIRDGTSFVDPKQVEDYEPPPLPGNFSRSRRLRNTSETPAAGSWSYRMRAPSSR